MVVPRVRKVFPQLRQTQTTHAFDLSRDGSIVRNRGYESEILETPPPIAHFKSTSAAGGGGSLVDKYASFIRPPPPPDQTEDVSTKIAEDFCVSLEEQERILREIAAASSSSQKPAAASAPVVNGAVPKRSPDNSSPLESKSR